MEESGGDLGSILDDDAMQEAYEVVEGVVYSSYSVILMELVAQDERAADDWLRLTAQGMKMTVSALAMQLYLYNRGKLGRHLRRYVEDGAGADD